MDKSNADISTDFERATRAARLQGRRVDIENINGAAKAVVIAVSLLANVACIALMYSTYTNVASLNVATLLKAVAVFHVWLIVVCVTVPLTVRVCRPSWTNAAVDQVATAAEAALRLRSDRRDRREALQQAVDAAAMVVSITDRLTRQNQFAEWPKLSDMNAAIESMMEHRSRMHVACIAAESVPDSVRSYVDAAEVRFDQLCTPQNLADPVLRWLCDYVGSERSPSYLKRTINLESWGYLDVGLRFHCRSNIDWVLVNAWRIGFSKFFDADFHHEVDEPDADLDLFRAWWSAPIEERCKSLPHEKILMRAPIVAYKTTAWDIENAFSDFPISNTLSNITDAEGAPAEYVIKLWSDEAAAKPYGRVDLQRIVWAARKIAR